MSVTLLVTIALAVLIAAATAGFTSRSRSARTAVIGAGWTALPVGLWLTGVTDLTVNGIASLIAWFQRTPLQDGTALADWVGKAFTNGVNDSLITAIQRGGLEGKGTRAMVQDVLQAALDDGFAITQQEAVMLTRTYTQTANVQAMEAVARALLRNGQFEEVDEEVPMLLEEFYPQVEEGEHSTTEPALQTETRPRGTRARASPLTNKLGKGVTPAPGMS